MLTRESMSRLVPAMTFADADRLVIAQKLAEEGHRDADIPIMVDLLIFACEQSLQAFVTVAERAPSDVAQLSVMVHSMQVMASALPRFAEATRENVDTAAEIFANRVGGFNG